MKEVKVYMANSLSTGKYNFKDSEFNFILALIGKINKYDKDFEEYSFTKKELENLTNTNLKYTRISQMADGLMGKVLHLNLKNEGFKKYTFFSTMEYKEGILKVCINEKMKPFFLNLANNFIETELKELISLKSYYSKRIYLLLKSNAFKGGSVSSFEHSISDLQEEFEVKKSLLNYADFKINVLEVALKEINEKTSLKFSYKPVDRTKIRKKIYDIEFTFGRKK